MDVPLLYQDSKCPAPPSPVRPCVCVCASATPPTLVLVLAIVNVNVPLCNSLSIISHLYASSFIVIRHRHRHHPFARSPLRLHAGGDTSKFYLFTLTTHVRPFLRNGRCPPAARGRDAVTARACVDLSMATVASLLRCCATAYYKLHPATSNQQRLTYLLPTYSPNYRARLALPAPGVLFRSYFALLSPLAPPAYLPTCNLQSAICNLQSAICLVPVPIL